MDPPRATRQRERLLQQPTLRALRPALSITHTPRSPHLGDTWHASSHVATRAATWQVRDYWSAELAAEGMMELRLPIGPTTNGSWLVQQVRLVIVRSIRALATWQALLI